MTFEDWALQRILSMDTPALAVGKVGKEPQDLSSRSATRPNRLEATDAPIEPPPNLLPKELRSSRTEVCKLRQSIKLGSLHPTQYLCRIARSGLVKTTALMF